MTLLIENSTPIMHSQWEWQMKGRQKCMHSQQTGNNRFHQRICQVHPINYYKCDSLHVMQSSIIPACGKPNCLGFQEVLRADVKIPILHYS